MSKLANQIEKLRNARDAAEASIKGIDEKLAELVPQYEAEEAAASARRAIDVDGLAQATQVAYEFDADSGRYRILFGSGFDAEFHVPSKDVEVSQ